MKIAYGYNRHPDDLSPIGADRVYVDMPNTKRQERGAMLAPGAMREGDVVAVFDLRDLGEHTRREIKQRGASIEVVEVNGAARKPGAPPKFTPTPEQDSAIKTLWLNPGYTLGYVLDRAKQIMGEPVARHQLVHRYGNRHKREPS